MPYKVENNPCAKAMHLSMGNSLLYGLPETQINRLAWLQNIAARIVTRSKPREHVTQILRELHWLPIKDRIVFKLLMLAYRSSVSTSPSYLSDLLHPYQANQSFMRSHNKLHLREICSNWSWGKRAFSVAAPTLWNSLPEHVIHSPSLASFKSSLKTHLMKIA